MADSNEQLQANTYIWSQSSDQVTISFLVPESATSKDLDIKIEAQHVKAGLKDQEPVFKAKLFSAIDHYSSLWQLEKTSISPFSSVATSPSFSNESSYMILSPTHSPTSSIVLPAPALESTSSMDPSNAQMADLLQQTAALGTQHSEAASDEAMSTPSSPVMVMSPTSSLAVTPPQLPSATSSHQHSHHTAKYRILTLHLEKSQEGLEWAIPVSAGYTEPMDLDVTSAHHLASWHETRMGNLQRALDYYLLAAERGHTASMIKAAALYEADKETVPNAKVFCEKDSKKAFGWYKRAADLEMPGYQPRSGSNNNGPDPLACYVVGSLYGSGAPEAEVEKNYQLALHYYKRCMVVTAPHIDLNFDLFEKDALPKSCLRNHSPQTRHERYFCSSAFQTGLIYLYGSKPEGEAVQSVTEVDVNAPLAVSYWRQAAVLGHAQACYNLGIVYLNGLGIDKDVFTAGKYFARALKLDNTQKLVPPPGVQIIADWDAREDDGNDDASRDVSAAASSADLGTSSMASSGSKKKQRRKKRRSTKKKDAADDDVLVWLMVAGSVTAMVGVAWYWLRPSAGQSSA